MGAKVTLLCLCILTALRACSTTQDENVSEKCYPDTFPLLTELKEAAEDCGSALLSNWTAEEKVQLLRSMDTLSEILKRKVCRLSDGSPTVEVHRNGGIVCVTIGGKVYCKPLCEHGYDFNFLRRSRPYEVCSMGSWTTQFIGGNSLAACFKSSRAISALPSAYFPKDQNCLETKRLDLQYQIIQQFITELRDQQITGEPRNPVLMCDTEAEKLISLLTAL